MSFEEQKTCDASDYDAISMTDSTQGSPTRKTKRKGFHLFSRKSRKSNLQGEESYKPSHESDLHNTNTVVIKESTIISTNLQSKMQPSLYNGETVINQSAAIESNTIITNPESQTIDISKEPSLSKKLESKILDTHQMHIKLLSGEGLAPRDSNGYSDPYVKFKLEDRTVYKSKYCKSTLSPRWDEKFTINVHMQSHVSLRVYDKDKGRRDDFMGSGSIALSELTDTSRKIEIHLEDSGSTEDEELGYIFLQVYLTTLENDSEDSDLLRSCEKAPSLISFPELSKSHTGTSTKKKTSGISVRSGMQPVALVSVQLISGCDLPAHGSSGLCDPYIKLSLGKQKRKSRVCTKTLNPLWKEEFIFSLHSEGMSVLDITVWNKCRSDDSIGRCELDLGSLDREITHTLNMNLIDNQGSILLLVTIHNLDPEQTFLTSYDLSQLRQQYGFSSSLANLSDIGFAEVRIVSASGLRSADINGKSDPFCVIQLCNARGQTQTCCKTLDPVWNRVMTFSLLDIHDVFEITVFDQDSEEEKDFLGKVAIPILYCRNGDVHTYTLKDRKLKEKTKGEITVQISYIFSQVRAAVRTFSPREEIYMKEEPKFKRSLLVHNFSRVWHVVQQLISTAEFINSCFTWENYMRSIMAFFAFITIVWNFQLYMLPIVLLMLLIKNYIDIFVRKVSLPRQAMNMDDAQQASMKDDDEDEDSSNKLSFMQRLRAIEEVLTKVQNILDSIASFAEKIYNTFTWSVPFLAWLLIVVLSVVCIILYVIPLRIIVLLWGINKFSKRLRNPNYVPNNEVMDFLSRIPSNVDLAAYREFPVDQSSPSSIRKRNK